MADNDPPSVKELFQFIENQLQQLQENFEDLTDKLSLQVDEMGERINDMGKHVAELMAEAGIENTSEDSECWKKVQRSGFPIINSVSMLIIFMQN